MSRTKLTPEQIAEIERLFQQGWATRKELAYEFGVSRSTLWRQTKISKQKPDPKSYDPLPK